METVLLGAGFVLNTLDRGLVLAQWAIYHLLVCLKNSRRLLGLLLSGTKTWVVMLGRLLIFTASLAPGWYNLLKYFFFCPLILRNVEYGKGARNRNLMDIYLPCPLSPTQQKAHGLRVYPDGAPVVVFVSGGAWMIGYKLWSALVGRGLAALGTLVVVPDYRNFPQGDIEDMMTDVRLALHWTHSNAHRFGGNPHKIVLAGQSAGAHICLCVLVEDFLREKEKEREREEQAEEEEREREREGLEGEREKEKEEREREGERETEKERVSAATTASSSSFDLSHSLPLSHTLSHSHSVHCSTVRMSVTSSARKARERDKERERERESESDSESERERERERLRRISFEDLRHVVYSDREGEREREKERETEREGESDSESERERESVVAETVEGEREEVTVEAERESETETESEGEREGDVSGVWREVEVEGERERETVRKPPVPASLSLPHSVPLSHTVSPPSNVTNSRTPAPPLSLPHRHTHAHHHSVLGIVRLFVGVSGPYNLLSLSCHLHERGLDASILRWICRDDLARFSPSLRLRRFVQGRERERGRGSESVSALSSAVSTTAEESVVGEREREAEGERERKGESVLWTIARTAVSALFTDNHSWYTGVPVDSETHGHLSSSPTVKGEREGETAIEGEGERGFLSPQDAFLSLSPSLLRDFPPTAIFHGSADQSIPLSISDDLVRLLDAQGADVHYWVYEGWTHTDAILEAPLAGNSRLFKDMLSLVYRYTEREGDLHSAQRLFAQSLSLSHALGNERERESLSANTTSNTTSAATEGEREREEHALGIEQAMVHESLVRVARVLNPF